MLCTLEVLFRRKTASFDLFLKINTIWTKLVLHCFTCHIEILNRSYSNNSDSPCAPTARFSMYYNRNMMKTFFSCVKDVLYLYYYYKIQPLTPILWYDRNVGWCDNWKCYKKKRKLTENKLWLPKKMINEVVKERWVM